MSIAANRDYVVLEAELRGMGRKASCTLMAAKVTLPQLNVWEYVKCEILVAPDELPNGQYEVSFEGRMMEIKKLDGFWLAAEV